VKADLERCRQSLIDDGAVTAFAIGLRDAASRFELPDRLYERDAEVLVLLDAFERVAQGASETVLVSGRSGSASRRWGSGPVTARTPGGPGPACRTR
jgi:hypothetical protein